MLKEQAKAALLKHGEVMLEGMIADLYEPAFEEVKAKAKDIIKGPVDDAVIELIMGAIKEPLKAALLAKVEELSPEV